MNNWRKSYTGIRAILFLGVFFYHASRVMNLTAYSIENITTIVVRLSVNTFFCLSGFLCSSRKLKKISYFEQLHHSYTSFLKKNYRWHAVFSVLMYPISFWAFFTGTQAISAHIIETISCSLLLQSSIPSLDISLGLNTVSWFLSTMLLMLPLTIAGERVIENLYVKYRKSGLYFAFYFLFMAQILTVMLPLSSTIRTWFLYISIFPRSLEYLIGFCLGKLESESEANIQKSNSLLFFGILLFSLIVISYNQIPETLTLSFIFTPVSLVILWNCASEEYFIGKLCSSKLLVQLGRNSKYHYISHYAVLSYIWKISSRFFHSLESSLVFKLFIIVLSYIIVVVLGLVMEKIDFKLKSGVKACAHL